MIAIEVCEREQERRMEYRNGVSIEHRQYHAQVKDRPEMWSCGDNRQEAIGNLISDHRELFDVEINYLGRCPR